MMCDMNQTNRIRLFVAALLAVLGLSVGTAVVHQEVTEPQPFVADPTPLVPGDVIDTSFWKLTLPSGRSESPTEIKQPALRSYESGAYFYDQRKPGDPQNYVVFIAHAGGVTTSGSKYPRSELREMFNDGKTLASWSNRDYRKHVMKGAWAITMVPKNKQHVVVAQIHDAADDIIMVRLERRRLFLEANGKDVGLLDSNYIPSTTKPIWFGLVVTADRTNGITVFYKRYGEGRFSKTVKYRKFGSGWYFKAGMYTQSNRTYDSYSAYGASRIFNLTVSHR